VLERTPYVLAQFDFAAVTGILFALLHSGCAGAPDGAATYGDQLYKSQPEG
jgi:hypothetical protein